MSSQKDPVNYADTFVGTKISVSDILHTRPKFDTTLVLSLLSEFISKVETRYEDLKQNKKEIGDSQTSELEIIEDYITTPEKAPEDTWERFLGLLGIAEADYELFSLNSSQFNIFDSENENVFFTNELSLLIQNNLNDLFQELKDQLDNVDRKYGAHFEIRVFLANLNSLKKLLTLLQKLESSDLTETTTLTSDDLNETILGLRGLVNIEIIPATIKFLNLNEFFAIRAFIHDAIKFKAKNISIHQTIENGVVKYAISNDGRSDYAWEEYLKDLSTTYDAGKNNKNPPRVNIPFGGSIAAHLIGNLSRSKEGTTLRINGRTIEVSFA